MSPSDGRVQRNLTLDPPQIFAAPPTALLSRPPAALARRYHGLIVSIFRTCLVGPPVQGTATLTGVMSRCLPLSPKSVFGRAARARRKSCVDPDSALFRAHQRLPTSHVGGLPAYRPRYELPLCPQHLLLRPRLCCSRTRDSPSLHVPGQPLRLGLCTARLCLHVTSSLTPCLK